MTRLLVVVQHHSTNKSFKHLLVMNQEDVLEFSAPYYCKLDTFWVLFIVTVVTFWPRATCDGLLVHCFTFFLNISFKFIVNWIKYSYNRIGRSIYNESRCYISRSR